MSKTKNTATFVLRIDTDLKEKVEAKAKATERSLNGHILALLKKDLEEKK